MTSLSSAVLPAARPRGFAAAVPGLLLLAVPLGMGTLAATVFSIVQEAAKQEMGLSDYDLSLVQGLAASIPLVLLSVPVGILIDRRNRIHLMIGLALVWTAGLAMAGLATGMETLFAARMLTSLGGNCAIAVAISIAADMCGPARRGAAMLVLTLGKWAGAAGAFALGGWLFGLLVDGGGPAWLGQLAPWRGVHLLFALASLILVAPLLLLREPERHEFVTGPSAPLGVKMRELWARRAFILPLFAGQIAIVMVDLAASIWAAPVLSRSYGLQPQQFAGWMGLVVFLAGVIGAIVGGIAADAGQRSRRRGGILLGAVITTGISVPAALFPIAPSVPLFAVALTLFLLCGTITGLIVSTAIAVLLPNELRGLCLGLFITFAAIIGYGVAPTLITWVSALLGGEARLGMALAMVGTVVSLLAFLAFPLAMRHAPDGPTTQPV